jgi:hypothetical protein
MKVITVIKEEKGNGLSEYCGFQNSFCWNCEDSALRTAKVKTVCGAQLALRW